MGPTTFYWLTRLPYVNTYLWLALAVLLLVNGGLAIGYFSETNARTFILRVMRFTAPAQVIALVVFVLTPSDGEVAAMIELEQGRGRVVVSRNNFPGSSGLKADFSYDNATGSKSEVRK